MATLYIKRQDKHFKKIAFGDNSKVRFLSGFRKVFYTFLHHKNGQSGLEYVALITVVAAVILSIVWLSNGRSIFQQKLESAFTTVGDKIVYEIERVR